VMLMRAGERRSGRRGRWEGAGTRVEPGQMFVGDGMEGGVWLGFLDFKGDVYWEENESNR
jgi:hypothetical protein